jgi:PAS domain S-box-containing protein
MFGYEVGEVLGRPLHLLIPAEFHERHAQHAERFAAGLQEYRRMSERPTLSAIHKSGTMFPAEITLSKIRVGDAIYFGAVVRDVSTRVAAERAAETADSRLRLIASVSHEIRTPLTAVLGYAQLLHAGDTAKDAESLTAIETIVHEANEIGFILEDLLVAARSDLDRVPMLVAPTPLRAQASAVADALVLLGDIQIVVVGEPEPVAVADPLRTRQVIRNLVTNALRHGLPPTRIEVEQSGGSAWVRVIDSGPGAAVDVIDSMFEMFVSGGQPEGQPEGQPGSFGLGLHVSRRLARAMGGDLTYAHTAGETVFNLRLPTAE